MSGSLMLQPKISFIFTNLDPSRKRKSNTELTKNEISPVKNATNYVFWSVEILEDEALHINSPIKLFGSEFDTGVQLQYFLDNRHGWIQMICGSIELSASEKKQTLDVGDGVAISNLSDINITALSDCEFILFDLP